MKKFSLFVLVFLIINTLDCQTVPSNCADSVVRLYYKTDADQLGLRRTWFLNDSYVDSVVLNKSLSQPYLDALTAVFNATALPARDTVVKKLNIHALHVFDMNHLAITADSNMPWMKKFQKFNLPTGNSTVDSLMTKYKLKQTFYFPFLWQTLTHGVSFEVDSNLNILALANIWKQIQGVGTAGENQSVLDGYDIYDTITTNYIQLTYYWGWDDCWNGCIMKHYWTFRVYNDCSVEYMGDSGPPLPPWAAINEHNNLKTIKVYPNPVSDILYFQSSNLNYDNASYKVLNCLGQILISGNFQSQDKLDLRELRHGVYYLQIQSDMSFKTIKILKE